jgi:hypothetical protein
MKCQKCNGTGIFVSYSGKPLGECFSCRGSGVVGEEKKPQPEATHRPHVNTDMVSVFEKEHPAELRWLLANGEGSEFYSSLLGQITRKGYLSEKQMACVHRGMNREVKPQFSDVKVNAEAIMDRFNDAYNSGLKWPKLHIGDLVISRAGDNSRNPGSLYVKFQGEYVGKINPEGYFLKSHACTDEALEAIKEIAEDVLKAAQLHGIETGQCSCCGRELTNPLSVELGIGPICRERWGL